MTVVAGGSDAAPIPLTTGTNVVIPPMMVMAITPPLMNAVTLQFSTGGDEDDCHEEGKEGRAAVMVISPSPTTGTGVPPTLMTENFYLSFRCGALFNASSIRNSDFLIFAFLCFNTNSTVGFIVLSSTSTRS